MDDRLAFRVTVCVSFSLSLSLSLSFQHSLISLRSSPSPRNIPQAQQRPQQETGEPAARQRRTSSKTQATRQHVARKTCGLGGCFASIGSSGLFSTPTLLFITSRESGSAHQERQVL